MMTAPNPASQQAPARLAARLFDGRMARARPVWAWLDAAGQLCLEARAMAGPSGGEGPVEPGLLKQHPASQVRWPERLRHGERQALLPDGSLLCEALDKDARQHWDRWALASGLQDSLVLRCMRSWRLVALSTVLSVALLASAWHWGIPWAAEQAAALVPATAEQQIGAHALAHMDRRWLKPSALQPAQRALIERRLAVALQRYELLRAGLDPQAPPMPAYRLHFRAAPPALGPNALTLPGGDIVITDALIELAEGEPEMLTGVLAHELGHVRHRHGMRLALQAGMAAGMAGLVFGDYSPLMAGLPAWLAGARYSRGFEREADLHTRDLLRAAGISPTVMARFFKRQAAQRQTAPAGAHDRLLPALLASHPADAERIAFFSAP